MLSLETWNFIDNGKLSLKTFNNILKQLRYLIYLTENIAPGYVLLFLYRPKFPELEIFELQIAVKIVFACQIHSQKLQGFYKCDGITVYRSQVMGTHWQVDIFETNKLEYLITGLISTSELGQFCETSKSIQGKKFENINSDPGSPDLIVMLSCILLKYRTESADFWTSKL